MDNDQKKVKTDALSVCPFNGNHPDMLIKTPERDKRLDIITDCEYTKNTETYD